MSKRKLALTRREHESFEVTTQFGETIRIEMIKIPSSQVKVCIEADEAVSIVRSELLEPVDG